MFDNDFIALLPEIFLIHVTVLLLIYGVVFSTSKSHHYPPLVRNVAWLGLLAILITIALMVSQPVTNANLCYNHLIMDNFTYFCKIGLLLSTACIILMCLQYFQQDT